MVTATGRETNARNMGKKGGWFSSIKKVFSPNSKDKPVNDPHKHVPNQNKKKNPFIPLFRKPSSIEKIFGDFEREQQHHLSSTPTLAPAPRASFVSPIPPSSPPDNPDPCSKNASIHPSSKASIVSPTLRPDPSSKASIVSPTLRPDPSSKNASIVSPTLRPDPSSKNTSIVSPTLRPEPSSKNTSIVSPTLRPDPSSKASTVSPSLRPEPSSRHHRASAATRIQTTYRGFAARRSFRALKGLVRLQGVVRGQNVKRQTANAMKYMQLVVRVQSQIQGRRIHMLDAQTQRNDRKWNLATLSEAGSHGDWDDSVLTKEQVDLRMHKKVEAIVKRERAMAYAYSNSNSNSNSNQLLKSTQTTSDVRGFPWWYNWLDRHLPSDHTPMTPPIMDTPTPRSSRMARTPLSTHLRPPRGAREFEFPTTDDQSLTSCPPFSAPNYMTPTVSAKAKAKVRGSGTDSKRRLSFPLWGKASNSVFSGNNTPTMDSRHSAAISVSNFSVDSAVSLPAAMHVLGRKPFNRFV